ncbi:hypothetical protein [Nocardiopsis algeriensis]|uniref:Uncharacterized protein n=1 Tax=Nocardiopsis algeriensis TaxID=1478215 RepID=A0A841IRR4_9ACTN|nr:hypothetical protein [Nocardiopsis algeriensis]MBB6120900.1 hypothetical protein [Nocardiopsis algeriensis]
MGDFLSSVLSPGLIDVLSALTPPALVAFVFCYFIIKLLRREMAPRRMDGSPVGKDEDAPAGSSDKDARSQAGEAGAMNGTSNAQDGERPESEGR